MTLVDLVQPGAGSPLFLLATASLLGALHGLEPGHAKTMMATFVIAVRGTAWRAVLLGLSAAASHTVIVWLLAGLGLIYRDSLIANSQQPYFSIAVGTIVLLAGTWTISRAWQARNRRHAHDHHGHHHHHGHDHQHGHHHHHGGWDDAHARAHTAELRDFFQGRPATTGQVILFGLTGGLIPCSAAVTVLLICLHQQQVLLGVGLVGAFTAGLAVILVAVGMIAALGLKAGATSGSRWIGGILRPAPLASGVVLVVVGLAMINSGLFQLGA